VRGVVCYSVRRNGWPGVVRLDHHGVWFSRAVGVCRVHGRRTAVPGKPIESLHLCGSPGSLNWSLVRSPGQGRVGGVLDQVSAVVGPGIPGSPAPGDPASVAAGPSQPRCARVPYLRILDRHRQPGPAGSLRGGNQGLQGRKQSRTVCSTGPACPRYSQSGFVQPQSTPVVRIRVLQLKFSRCVAALPRQ